MWMRGSDKSPDTEEKSHAFEYLRALAPEHAPSAIAAALSRAPTGDLLDSIGEAGRTLGLGFRQVETSLPALVDEADLLPVLELCEPPRVVLSAEQDAIYVLQGDERRRLPRTSIGQESRMFVAPTRAATLACLKDKGPLRRVWAYLKTERAIGRALVVYAFFVEALSLGVPLAVQILINTIGFGMLTQQLVVLSLALFLALAGAATLKVFQMVLVEHLSRRFFARTVMEYSERLGRVERGKMKHPIFRFFEVASVDKTFFVLGLDLVTLILQLVAATLLLTFYHPLLLGFTLVMLTSAWLVLRLPFGAALSRSLDESKEKYELAGLLFDDRVRELDRLFVLGHWEEARRAGFRTALGQQIGLFSIQVVLSVALLFLGGLLVIQGQLTLGQLVAAELVGGTALVSLGKMGKQLPKVYDLITSFEKLGGFVDLPLQGESSSADKGGLA